tara:strand:- start:824 stop:2035 length:1212 start_codon:yes stop_codon:yes gene_type:complete
MSSTEGNRLPEGWEIKSLADIGNIFSGNSINAKLKEEKYENTQGIPYVATKDISYNSVINYDNGINIPLDDVNKFRLAKKETIFICAEGGSAGRKVGLLNQDVYFVNKLFALETNSDINSKFCFYWYLSNEFKSNFKDKLKGLIGGVSKTDFKKLPIPIPPLYEQKRIVAKIDNLFAKIDKAISLTETSLVQAKNLLPSIIDETFDSFDAEKVDLKSISESIQYGYTGKTIEDGQYYYLRITDIQGGVVNYQAAPYSDIEGVNIAKYKLNKGDILFARTGATAGKSYLFNDDVDAVFASYLIRVVCNQDIVRPSFVKWFFLSANYWKQIYGNIIGAAQPNFNGKKLGELNLKVPSLGQQELVIDYLEKVSKQTKETQSKLEEQLRYLKQLKSSILSKAFKGEL